MGSQQPLLLFFDTFSHEVVEELNLDLVQFPSPVIVEEVRVIPLGARVQANFPGGVRLGATNPAQFQLEFFVNDLSKSGASTFESLGILQYSHDGKIHMETERRIPTDGLVLRGFYNAITLAVYGTLSKYTAEQLALQASRQHAESLAAAAAVQVPTTAPPPSDSGDQAHHPHMDGNYQPEHTIKTEPVQPPPQPAVTTDPWHYTGQQPSPQSKFNDHPKVETLPPTQAVDHMVVSPEKNSYPRSEGARLSERQYRDSRERGRHVSPGYDGERQNRRSRSGSRGKDWNDWSVNGRRSDSAERWPERHRGRRSSRSRSPPAPMREHPPFRRSRSPSPDRPIQHSPSVRGSQRSPLPKQQPPLSPSPRSAVPVSKLSLPNRNSISPARSHHSRTRSRSPTSIPLKIERATTPDVLEDVSDISDGDIPDIPEKEMDDIEPEVTKPVSSKLSEPVCDDSMDIGDTISDLNLEKKMSRPEDIEEISDEEAEWSDEGDPIYPMDFDVDFGEDWDYPVKEFDYFSAELKPLSYFSQRSLPDDAIDIATVEDKITSLAALNAEQPTSDWVELVEEMTPIVKSIKDAKHHNILIESAHRGLDFQVALDHCLPTWKIRHLKSGIKFTLALLECGGSIADTLVTGGVLNSLLSLFDKPDMAVSLKLLIVRTLDVALNCSVGLDIFIGRKSALSPDKISIYAKLICKMNGKMSMRLKCALSALIAKINLFEVLEQLRELCDQVIRWNEENNEEPLPLDTANLIIGCLEQALQFYQRAQFLIAQPLKYLPTRSHYELKDSLFTDPYVGYYSLWDSNMTLASLLELLVNVSTSVHSGITTSVQKILGEFLKHPHGLIYLNSHPEETNSLVRALLMGGDSAFKLQAFGLYLANCVHAFACVDVLFHLCRNKSRREMETMPVVEAIQTLHGLTFNTYGRLAVVNVISKGDLLDILIRLVQHSPVSEDNEVKRDMKKSAIRAYASELLLLVVRASGDVKYLKKFANVLLTIGAQDEASRLYELTAWLAPLTDEACFTPEGIPLLCDIIKKNADKLSPMSLELMTAVRILKMLCTEPKLIELEKNELEEQKYKITLLTVYSLDLIDQYLLLLGKICSYHEQPLLHLATFSGNNGYMLMSVVKPMIETMKNVIVHLIKCQQSEFKDTSPIACLLKVYAMSSVVGPSALGYHLSRKVCQDILCILTMYTTSGVWREMVKEVFKYIPSAPHTYTPGLEILSQLLPLPLPMQTQSLLTDDEIGNIETMRNLWSAHIFTLENEICELIGMICGSSIVSLQRLLQRVSIQLADLSAPIAVFVVKAVLDALKRNAGENTDVTEKVLAFLQTLLDQPTMKAAFLSVTFEQRDFSDIPSLFSQILSGVATSQWTSDMQESVACAIQALLDPDISLLPVTDPITEFYLANSLPNKDHFVVYFNSILDHLASRESNFGLSLSPIFRTLSLTAEFDFGLFHLKSALKRRNTLLPDFCNKFARYFSKDNPEHIQCLSALVIFLQTLVNESGHNIVELFAKPDGGRQHPITLLCDKVGDFKNEKEEEQLEEDESIDNRDILLSLYENLSGLATHFESANAALPSHKNVADDEPELPMADALLAQFQQRQIFVECDVIDDRILSDSWLATSVRTLTEDSSDQQVVSVDLVELSETYLAPDFNLISEVQKVCNEKMLEMEKRKKKSKKSLLEAKALQNKNLISTFKAGGAVPNMGGGSRGFQRSGQRLDAFRSRPPNTSRPPSLHVDDFLVLQSRGQQPTGPTGYNKQTLKAAQELFAQREAKKGAVGFREATKEPVFGGSNDNSNNGGSGMGSNRNRNSNLNVNLGAGNSSRGNGRNSSGLGGPSKLSFRGGRGGGEGGHIRGARGGGFNRDRLAPRGWSPSQRSDYSSRPSNNDGHFSSGRSNRPGIGGAGGGNSMQQQQQKDRKMKRSEDRPRHIRSSMDR